jgi:hypothetical protein
VRWLVTTSRSARRSSHPPPDARAHALHLLHLHILHSGISQDSSSETVRRTGTEASTRRLTDPTPAASTPAATAVAPEPTMREAMPNALNGIATAAPLLPRRNHASPAVACAALAAAHHGHLLASPPPPRSSISAAVTRVFGDRFSCWGWHSIVYTTRKLTDMWSPHGSIQMPDH